MSIHIHTEGQLWNFIYWIYNIHNNICSIQTIHHLFNTQYLASQFNSVFTIVFALKIAEDITTVFPCIIVILYTQIHWVLQYTSWSRATSAPCKSFIIKPFFKQINGFSKKKRWRTHIKTIIKDIFYCCTLHSLRAIFFLSKMSQTYIFVSLLVPVSK